MEVKMSFVSTSVILSV